MKRRTFIAGGTAAFFVSTMGGRQMFAEPLGAVGWTEVDLLRDAAIRLKRTDMRSGAGYALQQAEARGRQAKKVLEAPLATTSTPNLYGERATAVAWVFNNVAFMYYDVGYHVDAYGWWWRALEAAKDANNQSLMCRIYGQKARQDLAMGNPQGAIADLSQAIESDRHGELTATDLAMLHALRARAYGAIGDEKATVNEIGVADGYMFAQSDPHDSDERPWIGHYDIPHHRGDIGAALRSLVRHGYPHVAAALGNYERSLDDAADGNERTKVLVCGALANLHLTDGNPTQGFILGHEMMRLVAIHRVRSRRVVDRIVRLRDALDPYNTPEAGYLREHIVETLRFTGF